MDTDWLRLITGIAGIIGLFIYWIFKPNKR
jgi:hypothetical protein